MTGQMFIPGPSNLTLALTHASFGSFVLGFDSGSYRNSDPVAFHHGIQTLAATRPSSGKASLSGIVAGFGRAEQVALQTVVDVTGTSHGQPVPGTPVQQPFP